MKQTITFKILQVLYIVFKVVLNPVPYQLVIILHHTVHWTSKKGGTGGQGEVGGATNRVTCTWFESATVGTGWATYLPGSVLEKTLLSPVESWFLARKGAWAVAGCMTTDSADYCMLVNEQAWSKSQVCLLKLEMDVG